MAHQEAYYVKSARVRFSTEVKSLDALILVDQFGRDLAQLSLDPGDSTKRTWIGTVSYGTGGYLIPQEQTRVFGVEARLKPADSGAQSGESVIIDLFQVGLEGKDSGVTYESPPQDVSVYPRHVTAIGIVSRVTSLTSGTTPLIEGQNQLLGQFAIEGHSTTSINKVRIRSLAFQVAKTPGVTVTNWYLKTQNGLQQLGCTVSETTVSCSNPPDELALVNTPGLELDVYGTVAVDPATSGNFVILTINQAGDVYNAGALRWSDGSSEFSWVALPSPLATGRKNGN